MRPVYYTEHVKGIRYLFIQQNYYSVILFILPTPNLLKVISGSPI